MNDVDKSTPKEQEFQGQVDLDRVAEGQPSEEESLLEDFFSNLELQVDGAIFDESRHESPQEEQAQSVDQEGRKQSSKPESKAEVGSGDEELEKLRKAYSESSREAKKLAKKIKEYEEYDNLLPVLKVMREDPILLQQVRDYLEEGSAPQTITKYLDLPEDFIFDGDEAIKDPRSDSAKVFNAMVDAAVSRKMSAQEQKRSSEVRKKNDEEEMLREFQKTHNISDDDLEEFVEWAKDEKLTLDHLWFLKNRNKRDQEILKGSFEERQRQLARMQQTPTSLASKNVESRDRPEEDVIFDEILKFNRRGAIFQDD
jgi:hypothetical protein